MPFFQFSQNNSGGSFYSTRDPAITHHVVIEAKDADDANIRAIQIGLYFNGCNQGIDCSCCGDRWYPAHGAGDKEPKVYGRQVGEPQTGAFANFGSRLWATHSVHPEVIHFADGRIVWGDEVTK